MPNLPLLELGSQSNRNLSLPSLPFSELVPIKHTLRRANLWNGLDAKSKLTKTFKQFKSCLPVYVNETEMTVNDLKSK